MNCPQAFPEELRTLLPKYLREEVQFLGKEEVSVVEFQKRVTEVYRQVAPPQWMTRIAYNKQHFETYTGYSYFFYVSTFTIQDYQLDIYYDYQDPDILYLFLHKRGDSKGCVYRYYARNFKRRSWKDGWN